jgi:hypothetical protein
MGTRVASLDPSLDPETKRVIALLDFGDPRALQMSNGVDFGATGFLQNTTHWPRTTVSLDPHAANIQILVEWFIDGFYRKSDPSSHVRVIVGTNNHGPNVTLQHGAAWGRMVNDIAAWVQANGIAGRVDVAGGYDVEINWSTPAIARAWVDGYNATAQWALYDFGDAQGCPPCDNGWTMHDLWYVAWGAPFDRPLPEIYNRSGKTARNWAALNQFSQGEPGGVPPYDALLSQSQACAQDPAPCSHDGTDNTPQEAWTLYTSYAEGDGIFQVPPPGSVDIKNCFQAGCAP